MQPLRTLALLLVGLLCLAGAASAQDLTGAADATTDKATAALDAHARESAAGADATAAAEGAAATVGADAEASQPGDDEGLWARFGLHLGVMMAKLHELAAMVGLAAPDVAGDLDVNVAEDGVDFGLATERLQVEKSVSTPDGRADAAAGVAGQAPDATAAGDLAGGVAVPTLG